jgi:hypothetical protein
MNPSLRQSCLAHANDCTLSLLILALTCFSTVQDSKHLVTMDSYLIPIPHNKSLKLLLQSHQGNKSHKVCLTRHVIDQRLLSCLLLPWLCELCVDTSDLQVNRLQRIHNSLANKMSHSSSHSTLLGRLQWLPVEFGIRSKLACLPSQWALLSRFNH